MNNITLERFAFLIKATGHDTFKRYVVGDTGLESFEMKRDGE